MEIALYICHLEQLHHILMQRDSQIQSFQFCLDCPDIVQYCAIMSNSWSIKAKLKHLDMTHFKIRCKFAGQILEKIM